MTIPENNVGGSLTSGYDALVLMNQDSLNQVLYAQYIDNHPGQQYTTMTLGAADSGGTNYYLLNLNLDTPDLSFPADLSSGTAIATLQMLVGDGSYMLYVDLTQPQPLQYGVQVNALTSSLVGTYPLSAVAGEENTVGQTTLDLAGSTGWSVTLNGLDSDSAIATSLGNMVQAHFAVQPQVITLNTVVVPGNVPASLTPTSFSLSVPKVYTADQQLADPPRMLALQVVTSGSAGTPLSQITCPPYAEGQSVYLAVSADIVASLIATSLQGQLANTQWQASVPAQGSTWTVSASADSTLNIGTLNVEESPYVYVWCGTDDYGPIYDDVVVPVSNLVFTGGGGALTASLGSTVWQQNFVNENAGGGDTIYTSAPGTITAAGYGNQYTTSLSNNSLDTFVFQGSATPTTASFSVTADTLLFSGVDQPGCDLLNQAFDTAMGQITLPGVNEFLLSSLVCPVGDLTLSQAGLPFDLWSAGTFTPIVAVTPTRTVLSGGESVTLTAASTQANDPIVGWTCNGAHSASLVPQAGEGTAVYTAPKVIGGDGLMIIKAISQQGNVGYASIAMSALDVSPVISVTPAGVLLPPNGTITLTVVDNDSGNPSVQASGGTLVPLGGPLYSYTAPATPGPVVISVSDGANSFSTTCNVVAVDTTLSITASADSVAPGGTLTLSAADTGYPDATLQWYVVPVGTEKGPVGSLSANAGTQVTYTAPATVTATTYLWVVAWQVTPPGSTSGAIGVAKRMITVSAG